MQYRKLNNSTIELKQNVLVKDTNNQISSIDWEKLKEINNDIIGWIKIEDTNIDYPILQSDDLYYLEHTYENKYNKNGSIFTLDNNAFEDKKTIIHGHNMRNGIMFSELSKYMNKDFFETHSNFEIYTPKVNYKATVFSCYSIGVNTEDKNIKALEFEEEIEYYKNTSKYLVNDIGKIEKIVKLSTCSYLNNTSTPTNQRYYIIAKLEKID